MMDRIQRMYSTPERRARLMKILWWVSTGFTLLGFVVIAYLILW